MATIYVDGTPYEVDGGENLLHACLSLGFDIPYFCWHPALGSVGACRQCAVKQFRDEQDTQGRLVMACMTPAAEGTRLSIIDPEAAAFRKGVIEWLMTNHPHDCPVCDEGGECHLQDMTLMTGHAYRRYRFKKRTFRNQYLGPFITHEMNRCIACYRCVRFYRDYAGGRDLDAFASHNHVYFGRHEDGVLENEFSGNLVEVCPTGVFTDKTLGRHYTRKWDLQTAPSVCVHCGLGCNTIPGERYGQLRRILNRYHEEVNGYFLCDRGRFGYEFVNSDTRVRTPLLRDRERDTRTPAPPGQALRHGAALLSAGSVVGIGSPRASLEANFALRTLVGPEHFSHGMAEREARLIAAILAVLRRGPARSPSLRDVAQADAVLVLGEDLVNVAPRLALAVRQSVRQRPMAVADALKIPRWNDAAVREAVQQDKGPLFLAAPSSTRLDDLATRTYHAAPDDVARLGFAVAHTVRAEAPAVTPLPERVQALASAIAQALRAAQRPLVIAGTSCGSEAVIQAAANVAWALCEDGRPAGLCYVVPECNSLGLGLLGGRSIEDACAAVQDGRAHTVIILENDLYRRADQATVETLLHTAAHVIAIDSLDHLTTARADVVLPASTFAEGDGTLVNNEGRAQRFFQVFVPAGDVQESWRWLRDLMHAAGRTDVSSWRGLDDVTRALARALPVFARLPDVAPPGNFRIVGRRIPRQPPRYSGRTAMVAHVTVHEPKPPEDPDAPLAFSMEGYPGQPPPSLIPYFWAPGWNSAQATAKFQSEVGGPLRGGNPGVRLIAPDHGARVSYFQDVPPAFTPRGNEWFVIPLYHIFGSEELSTLAPAVAARSPAPYAALHPDDAAGLGLGAGEELRLTVAGTVFRLPVQLRPALPRGVVGLPAGFPELQGVVLPAWGTVRSATPAREVG
ncbi:MAG: NADH-quinone oxidoreductase subunit NuoG [Thermodesulfobacteriota bacterium]